MHFSSSFNRSASCVVNTVAQWEAVCFNLRLQPLPRVEMKRPPMGPELHKHKSDEDNNRKPGGLTTNIAPEHMQLIPSQLWAHTETADHGEIWLMLMSQTVGGGRKCTINLTMLALSILHYAVVVLLLK